MRKLFFVIAAVAAMCFAGISKGATPYKGPRIFWDLSSLSTVFSSGGYARMIQLQDKRLMAVCESGGINVATSSNRGRSWSSPRKIAINSNNVPNCTPDLIQLSDGTIIVAYNPRPSTPYTADRHFGIRCKRSTDNGRTWSSEIFVYDADTTFSDGCWEPTLLELPSGEVQLYYSDEGPYTSSSEQQISLCRSFDKGQTWSSPEKVSFRAGYRDGMPCPILLNGGDSIVLAIEDNGWSGYNDFFPTTVRCDLRTNWHDYYVSGSSSNRAKTLDLTYCPLAKGGAPYLRQMPSGPTILSYQSSYGRTGLTMRVAVGDEYARGFKALSSPFYAADGVEQLWNSLAIIDSSVVVAVCGQGGQIRMIKGYLCDQLQAPFAHPTVDGSVTATDGYLTTTGNQIKMGTTTGNTVRADFAYDADSLYFTAYVRDATRDKSGTQCDAVRLLLDANNVCGTAIRSGMYSLLFRRDSTVQLQKGTINRWVSAESDAIHYAITNGSYSYTIEAAIPWSVLGKDTVPLDERMAAAVEVISVTGTTVQAETIPDVNSSRSRTYIELRLKPADSSTGIAAVRTTASLSATVRDGRATFRAPVPIRQIILSSSDGAEIARAKGSGTSLTIRPGVRGVIIARALLSDGTTASAKLSL